MYDLQYAQTKDQMIDKLVTSSKLIGAVALLRHADRDKIPDGEFGNDVMLNEKGISNSIHFGKKLRNIEIVKILTSPIQRCVQTAEYIVEGFGKSIPIAHHTALGDPGMHVTNAELAGNYYLKHGGYKMYAQFIAGEHVPGMPSIESFRLGFGSFLCEQSNEDGLTLMITHDFLIAVADYALNRNEYSPSNWVNYLDGFIIQTR